jgi:hypothetical protein
MGGVVGVIGERSYGECYGLFIFYRADGFALPASRPPLALFAIVSAVFRNAMSSHFRDRYREFGSFTATRHTALATISPN